MKYYLYAVFFVVLGVGFVITLFGDSTPVSLNSLKHHSNVYVAEWEETLKGTESKRITIVTTDNKQFTFETWLPGYSRIVDYIKNGDDMDLWSDGKIVYQITTLKGPNALFENSVAAKRKQDQMVSLFLGLISIAGLLWSIRQIKQQKALAQSE